METVYVLYNVGKKLPRRMASEEEDIAESSKPSEQERRIRDLRKEKRNAKSQMTRLLTKLSGALAEQNPRHTDITDLLTRIEEQKDFALSIMQELEIEYRDSNAAKAAEKVSDEADALVEQVDRETGPARLLLASLVKVKSRSIVRSIEGSEISERRRQKERAEVGSAC